MAQANVFDVSRYTRQQLVDWAKQLGIVVARPKPGKGMKNMNELMAEVERVMQNQSKVSKPKSKPEYRRKKGGIDHERYEELKLISAGNGGAVWQGRDRLTGQPIVIKHPIGGNMNEWEILNRAGLTDPNCTDSVVCMKDHVVQDRDEFFVMDDLTAHGYVKFEQWLRSSPPLTDEQALEIGQALFSTVDMLNNRRIVHGDLAPRNIMFHPERQTFQLIDFEMGCYFPDPYADEDKVSVEVRRKTECLCPSVLYEKYHSDFLNVARILIFMVEPAWWNKSENVSVLSVLPRLETRHPTLVPLIDSLMRRLIPNDGMRTTF